MLFEAKSGHLGWEDTANGDMRESEPMTATLPYGRLTQGR